MPLIPVTIHTYMENPTPAPETRVSVWTEEYESCVFDGYTDTNGEIVFALDPGIYSVFVKKDGVVFTPLPLIMELIADPMTIHYNGTVQTYPAESNGTVYLYGDIKDLTMSPLNVVKVQVYLTANPQSKNGALLDKSILELYTDDTGRWGTLLPAGSSITVVILSSNFQRTGILPFTGRINVLDLI